MIKDNEIIMTIREARKAKGLSQRELSSRIGVPQSHISKIESGVVDIQLSSLTQIARALDLELKLVPRKSLPAVESVIDSVTGDRTVQALNLIARAKRTLDRVILPGATDENEKDIRQLDETLKSLQALRFDSEASVRLEKLLEPITKLTNASQDLYQRSEDNKAQLKLPGKRNSLAQIANELKKLRNSLASHFDAKPIAHIPVYSLEDDDD